MPLDPEIAAYLDAQKALPPRSALTLEQTRERMVEAARRYGGEPVELARVEDRVVAAGIPVREYSAKPDASPLLLYFHGGRFISGNLDSHDRLCRRLAIASGFRVVAVDYRLAPEHRYPAAVEDALAAADWALGQTDRVVVAGDSAGANLAAVVAAERRQRIACQVLIYPMIDATRSLGTHREYASGWGPGSVDMQRGWDEYLSFGIAPRTPEVSPLFRKDLENLPPALVITAEFDSLRDEGEHYAEAMGLAGNRVELKRCLGTIHGFVTLTGISRIARDTVDDIGGFLKRCETAQ